MTRRGDHWWSRLLSGGSELQLWQFHCEWPQRTVAGLRAIQQDRREGEFVGLLTAIDNVIEATPAATSFDSIGTLLGHFSGAIRVDSRVLHGDGCVVVLDGPLGHRRVAVALWQEGDGHGRAVPIGFVSAIPESLQGRRNLAATLLEPFRNSGDDLKVE